MKYFLFVLIFSIIAQAQDLPKKGDVSIGGNFLFASTNSDNSSTTLLQFSPEFSYFVDDNFEIGTTMTIQSYQYSNTRNTTIGLGPFLSAHFKTASINPFVGISLTYLNQKVSHNGQTAIDYSENSINLFGGILVPLNEKVAIQPLIQYSLYFSKDIELGEISQIMLGVGIKAFL